MWNNSFPLCNAPSIFKHSSYNSNLGRAIKVFISCIPLNKLSRKYDPNLPATWTEVSAVNVPDDRKEKIEPEQDVGLRHRTVLEPIVTK